MPITSPPRFAGTAAPGYPGYIDVPGPYAGGCIRYYLSANGMPYAVTDAAGNPMPAGWQDPVQRAWGWPTGAAGYNTPQGPVWWPPPGTPFADISGEVNAPYMQPGYPWGCTAPSPGASGAPPAGTPTGAFAPGAAPPVDAAASALAAATAEMYAAIRGAGAAGAMRMPMPQLPLTVEPVRRQEPMKLGMFEGSATFLSAEVIPDGSRGASQAIAQGDIRGRTIVKGLFRVKAK